MVVWDCGPLVDQRDGQIFSQMGGITGHEGSAAGHTESKSFSSEAIAFV